MTALALSPVRRIEAEAEAAMRAGVRARLLAEVERQEAERTGLAAKARFR